MQKQLLTNITIIRPILIVLLVFYHAFAIYSGGWDPIEGFPDVHIYLWLDKLSYAFMLETFVFVSGYVFGYQVRIKGTSKLEAKSLLISKLKRLIIPSMFFSLLYIIIFQNITQPVVNTIYDMLNGVGHMWFLPMLFWCFIAIWLIEKMNLRPGIVLPILLICSICSFIQLPLRLNTSMYYMLFFYVGYIIQRKDVNIEKFYYPSYVISLSLLFLVLFTSITYFERMGLFLFFGGGEFVNNNMVVAIVKYAEINTPRILYSSVGLAMLMALVGFYEKNCTKPVPDWIVTIGGLCMGVYLLQQFILKVLYDYTALPAILGPYWLPWIGFLVTLSFSLTMSYTIRLTKVGRFLIG